MSRRTVKQLRDLEIDEVSLVDKPANQHGLVAITKRDEGTAMDELFDEHGRPVDEDSLQPGDVAYTADGERLVMLTDDDVDALLEQGYDVQDIDETPAEAAGLELSGVGKNAGNIATSRTVRGAARLGNAWSKAGEYATGTVTRRKAAGAAAITGGATSAVSYVGGRSGRRETKAARYTPSLGREVAAELSKALNDDDRDSVVSKVAEHVDRLEQVAMGAISKAERLEAYIEDQGWLEVAKGYEVPAAEEEVAAILSKAASVMSPQELDTLDRIFKSAGEQVFYDESGVAGYTAESEIMDQVNATVREIVGKADITPEQATTALFESNPGAYDAYLSER